MNILLALASLLLIGGYLYAPFLRRIGHKLARTAPGAGTEVQAKAASIQASASSSATSQWSISRPGGDKAFK